jgi:hypothetical protein
MLVPVRTKDAEDFEFYLRLPILSFTAPYVMDNTEELSLLAIDGAKPCLKIVIFVTVTLKLKFF